jgi:hypothetical protein
VRKARESQLRQTTARQLRVYSSFAAGTAGGRRPRGVRAGVDGAGGAAGACALVYLCACKYVAHRITALRHCIDSRHSPAHTQIYIYTITHTYIYLYVYTVRRHCKGPGSITPSARASGRGLGPIPRRSGKHTQSSFCISRSQSQRDGPYI